MLPSVTRTQTPPATPVPHKSIGASGLGDAALSSSTPSSATAASSAAQDTPRSSVATDGQEDDDELAQQPSDAGDEALSAPATQAADVAAAAAPADAPCLALVPASGDAQPQEQQAQQQEAAPLQHSFNIWSDTEDVLRQMVAWLAGLETVVCQGRVAAEPAAATRSRSYLSVHKVAALLAGGCQAESTGSWARPGS